MRTSTCAHYLKSYFSCLLSSRFLDGFEAVLGFCQFSSSNTTLKKREGSGNSNSCSHGSTRSRLSRENCKDLKFCFGRAKLESYSVTVKARFSHNAWAGKTSMFCHFECVPPKPVSHFSHQAHPRQLLLFRTTIVCKYYWNWWLKVHTVQLH